MTDAPNHYRTLTQSVSAMLAQANLKNQAVLQLLG